MCVFTVVLFPVPCLTDLVARRQVLVLVTRVPLLPVQQQEVNHLLLVVTVGDRRKAMSICRHSL